jgi:two-component system cell cycle response regulator DivK
MATKDLGKIFVVEDNALNLRFFSDILKLKGYEVAGTQDGNMAIEMIRKFIPDLIFMDVQLNGVSGLDLVRQIKKDKYIGSIKIIVVSAFAMKDDRNRIMASGCDAFVAKPIDIENLIQMVAAQIVKK